MRQAHIAWHKRACNDLKKYGFIELPSAPCVLRLNHSKFAGEVFLLVYVDDILVLSDTDEGLEYAVTSMKSLYEIRVSNEGEWFLGVQVEWGVTSDQIDSVRVSQPLYIESILRRFAMEKANPTSTPMIESF